MAKLNDAVMTMVRSELQKNPGAGSGELYEKAKKMNRAIGRLSVQQFHARYPLPVLRERAAAKRKRGGGGATATRAGRRKAAGKTAGQARKGGRRRKSAAPAKSQPAATAATPASETQPRSRAAGSRANVQEVLLQFAGVVAAGDKADMLQLMLRLDTWVDRVMEAAQ